MEFDEFFGVALEKVLQDKESLLTANLSLISLKAIIMQAFLALAVDPSTLKVKVQQTISQLSRLWKLQFKLAVLYRKNNGSLGSLLSDKNLINVLNEMPDDEETREMTAEVALPLLRKVFALVATLNKLGIEPIVDEKDVLASTSNLEELQALQS